MAQNSEPLLAKGGMPAYEQAVLSVFPSDRALSIREIHAKFMALRRYSGHTVRKALVNLTRDKKLQRVAHGRYALPSFDAGAEDMRPWVLRTMVLNADRAMRPKDLAVAWRKEKGFPLPPELFDVELRLLVSGGPVRELQFGVYQYWPDHSKINIFEE